MPQLGPFQKRIGYAFRNQGLMVLALTHPSVGHEKDKAESNNQRLEFLGDAVLQLVISTALYKQFSQHDEGTLSKVRARLVNREELASRARDIKLGAQLNVSRGEEKNGGRNRDSALADAFEALIGAIYLDGGFTKVRLFILTQFKTALKDVDVGQHIGNPKGELQELLQAHEAISPEYRMLDASGPDHDRTFICAVRHKGRELARGQGKSKKIAETQAAATAIIAFEKSSQISKQPNK